MPNMTEPLPTQLLGGPPAAVGGESLADHRARFGPLRPRPDLLLLLEQAGLRGRGGGSFPVARKWQSVAGRAGGDARLLVNGAEGDPLSHKDNTLMAVRPHLVLDGAEMAATAVGATEIVVYVGARHAAARRSLARALAERHGHWRAQRTPARLVIAPDAYVAGEESAAVHFVNDGDARPTTTPPRPYLRGLAGRPTLVHNVETLARAALIGHAGDAATAETVAGQTLVTVTAASGRAVVEAGPQTSVAALAARLGVDIGATQAVLLGGYFGRWTTPITAWSLPIDGKAVHAAGLTLGSGMVSFCGRSECGVALTARMIDYLAGQSAAQCGPCVFGLRAVADTLRAVAGLRAGRDDLARLERWRGQLFGRGACHHPDGAAALLGSAMVTFGDDFDAHVRRRRCQARLSPVAA
jgi:NADH:ubiquinone oxidoreductase subunit F (NADH-binding)